MNESSKARLVRLVVGSILYQGVWFAAVFSAWDAGRWWWGPASAVLYMGLAVLVWPAHRVHLFRMVVVALAIGVVVDALMPWLGAWRAERTLLPAPLPPLWLLALWCAFGTYISLSLEMLYGRYWLSAAVGAVGGTMAYRGGVVFGAVTWGEPAWVATLTMAVGWALVFPLLTGIAGKLRRTSSYQGK